MHLIALLVSMKILRVIRMLTSSSNGIDGPPFIFLGFNRGSNASINAFPPILHIQPIFQYYYALICISKNWKSMDAKNCSAPKDKSHLLQSKIRTRSCIAIARNEPRFNRIACSRTQEVDQNKLVDMISTSAILINKKRKRKRKTLNAIIYAIDSQKRKGRRYIC